MNNELIKYLQKDEKGRWFVAFGQYSGTLLDDVVMEDPEYTQWILNSDFPEPVKIIVEEALA